jgi:hypothetical protein
MNARRAAALALVGWYLMVPPFDAVNLKTLPSGNISTVWKRRASLPEWNINGSFGKAGDCEDEKAKLQQLGLQNPDQVGSSTVAAWLGAQCVATDDPRLKP